MKVVIKANDKHKTYSLACDVASLNDLEFVLKIFSYKLACLKVH